MLARCRVWAVVGDSMNPLKPAHSVAARYRQFQKSVHLVNPRDERCLPSLSAAGEKIDAVNLIISPKVGPSIVDEMIALDIKNLFIQPGAGTPEIVEKARGGGIEVLEGCVLVTPDSEFKEGGAAPEAKM
ncbi:hypothetical protein TeGR_g1721 [Tetraparma gracilis]|uniref:CoA-binding domain-containing protein n=1 Tax=Tetraparma gracilis TaxID=2962635 RepID=A0ABQ6N6Z7_9STRA|nr:hypothetical protein TeGR_g1721 [Tetraparma gracilis]